MKQTDPMARSGKRQPSSMPKMPDRIREHRLAYDVVILGGGYAGLMAGLTIVSGAGVMPILLTQSVSEMSNASDLRIQGKRALHQSPRQILRPASFFSKTPWFICAPPALRLTFLPAPYGIFSAYSYA